MLGPTWNVSAKLRSTIRKTADHRTAVATHATAPLGSQAEYPEDLRPGDDRHERPEQAGRLEERHGHRREPELHVRSRLLDPVGPIQRVDDDQEQVRRTPERDHRAQGEQSQRRLTLDARDLVPDQDVGFVREERPQGRFELVDRQVTEAGRPAACAREVGQSQDHADQDEGQERDGGEHRVETQRPPPRSWNRVPPSVSTSPRRAAAGIGRQDSWSCAGGGGWA